MGVKGTQTGLQRESQLGATPKKEGGTSPVSHLLLEEGCLLARHLYFKQSQSLLSHAKATLHCRSGREKHSQSLSQAGRVGSPVVGHDSVCLQPWSLSESPSFSLNPKNQKWMGRDGKGPGVQAGVAQLLGRDAVTPRAPLQ